jgi:hypothetical protein
MWWRRTRRRSGPTASHTSLGGVSGQQLRVLNARLRDADGGRGDGSPVRQLEGRSIETKEGVETVAER